jgi:uncharacterized protein YndB with AHSA1/START domain
MPVASSRTRQISLPSDTQIVIAREFDAPKHLVYRAWTTPELVKRWWAVDRSQMTTCEIDLQVGGRWRYAILANDGVEVAFWGVYREIVPNERIVSTEVFEGRPDVEALNTTTFLDTPAGSRLEILVQHTSQANRDAQIAYSDSMPQALDLLEQVARSLMSSMTRTDTASRVIAIPRERAYAAFVDPDALVAWLPPNGMTGRFERFDARPGGSYRMVLTYADGSTARGKATPHSDIVEDRFVDIVPGVRVVQAVDFVSDEPGYAGTMTMTWEVATVEAGTRLVIRAENVPAGISAEDHAAGLASSLAKLAAYLER